MPSRPRSGDVGQLHAAALGGRLAQHQGGAGGGVDLAPVVGLEDLDVLVAGRQGAGGLGDQAHQHVDAQREVAGADDGDLARAAWRWRRAARRREAGRADHQGRAAARGAGLGQGRPRPPAVVKSMTTSAAARAASWLDQALARRRPGRSKRAASARSVGGRRPRRPRPGPCGRARRRRRSLTGLSSGDRRERLRPTGRALTSRSAAAAGRGQRRRLWQRRRG